MLKPCAIWGMNSKGFIARTMASFRPERRAPGDYGDMKGITQEPLVQFCIFHENDIDKEIKVQLHNFNCPFDIFWWVVLIVFLSLWICGLRCAICVSLIVWWVHDRRLRGWNIQAPKGANAVPRCMSFLIFRYWEPFYGIFMMCCSHFLKCMANPARYENMWHVLVAESGAELVLPAGICLWKLVLVMLLWRYYIYSW